MRSESRNNRASGSFCSAFGLLILILLLLSLLTVSTSAQEPVRELRAARSLIQDINSGNFKAIQARFDPEMKSALPPAQAEKFFQEINEGFGRLKEPKTIRNDPDGWSVSHIQGERGGFDLKLALDAVDRISGLLVLPMARSSRLSPTNQTPLRLPFGNHWFVVWGGDTKELNYHLEAPNQTGAFDFIGVGPDGQTRRHKSGGNEDFYAFGREVLAPADGKVLEVIDGVRDNHPGSINPYSGVGNCLMIQHREDEVSVLAHLKLGSIRVKVGDVVKAGQVLGLCGNSLSPAEFPGDAGRARDQVPLSESGRRHQKEQRNQDQPFPGERGNRFI